MELTSRSSGCVTDRTVLPTSSCSECPEEIAEGSVHLDELTVGCHYYCPNRRILEGSSEISLHSPATPFSARFRLVISILIPRMPWMWPPSDDGSDHVVVITFLTFERQRHLFLEVLASKGTPIVFPPENQVLLVSCRVCGALSDRISPMCLGGGILQDVAAIHADGKEIEGQIVDGCPKDRSVFPQFLFRRFQCRNLPPQQRQFFEELLSGLFVGLPSRPPGRCRLNWLSPLYHRMREGWSASLAEVRAVGPTSSPPPPPVR